MTLLSGKPAIPDTRPERTVLVVDDVPEIGALYRALLRRVRKVRVRVVVEVRSAAAIEALQQRKFDLVITDLRMPGGSGMEVIAAAKRQDPAAAVILMSGNLGAQADLPADIAAVISKPLDSVRLLGLVEALLGGDAVPPRGRVPSALSEGNGGLSTAPETELFHGDPTFPAPFGGAPPARPRR